MRLLIAGNDRNILQIFSTLFTHEGYCVDIVSNGRDAYDFAQSNLYDGILMDVRMSGLSGPEVLKSIRKAGITTPVILLSENSSVEDRINGLDAGADDFMTKPFAINELVARVRAALRRRDSYRGMGLAFHGLSLELSSCLLLYQDNAIRLVGRELQMMQLLMESPSAVISTNLFLEKIWGWDSDVDSNIVWVYISNLRKKLKKLDAPIVLKAIRGVGYCLEATQEGLQPDIYGDP